ncbi:hypothetical protein [Paenibacillus oleatilyticus]|uniref:hypothetical protein n=1 Tax=Paenibacillus oleatilyticus TaxID=2594886 RepID=UPI001C1FF07D|nr:hypothetical protein [Paenibacillus oleatilyticus]MBU7316160.1 hypothetical protein [Paenibacillus oleatilyticus]
MKLYPDYINKINYTNKSSIEDVDVRITQLIKRLQDEPHMSMVRDVFDDVEIVVMKQFHIEDQKEYIRITVNRQREELLMRLQDFNLLFDCEVPSSLPDGECEECNKKNENI